MKKKKIPTERELLYQKNIATIQKFEQPLDEQKRFVRTSIYMMQHPNYKALSLAAMATLSYMKGWAFASEEFISNQTFDYSTTMLERDGILTRTTARRAFKELQHYGFIEKANNATKESGTTQKWRFSDEWYKSIKPKLNSNKNHKT